MVDLEIHPVRPDDLPLLVRAGGQAGYFTERLDRQRDGRGLLIAAWRGGKPLGTAYLWCEDAEEPEIREHLPGTPLITHLEVFASADRNRRVGTRLIQAAEQFLRARGYVQTALAVEMTNEAAARLYRRLGYCDWDQEPVGCIHRDWMPGGTVEETFEKCLVLVKRLVD